MRQQFSTRPFRRSLRRPLLAIGGIAFLCVLFYWLSREPLPVHKGRTVAEWFATFQDAGGYIQYAWRPAVQDAAREIIVGLGEDALPYLTGMAGRHPPFTATDHYARLLKNLPRQIVQRLPVKTRDPRASALWLVGAIGNPNLHSAWKCRGDPRRCNEMAVAALRKALRRQSMRPYAYQVIESMGSSADGASAELILLLDGMCARARVDPALVRTLGCLGGSASNAVPQLIRLVEDKQMPPNVRYDAALSLGEIGGPARPAGPVIGRLLVERRQADQAPNHLGLEMALARTGGTPAEAVPELKLILQRGGALRRAFAAVALWSCDSGNSSYEWAIRGYLRDALEKPGEYTGHPLLVALGCHGKNAAVFETEIRALAESGKPALTNCARQTLQRITLPQ